MSSFSSHKAKKKKQHNKWWTLELHLYCNESASLGSSLYELELTYLSVVPALSYMDLVCSDVSYNTVKQSHYKSGTETDLGLNNWTMKFQNFCCIPLHCINFSFLWNKVVTLENDFFPPPPPRRIIIFITDVLIQTRCHLKGTSLCYAFIPYIAESIRQSSHKK